MNDLKLNLKRPKRILEILICVAVSIFTSCTSNHGKTQNKSKISKVAADSLRKLPITYVTDTESINRQSWFDNHKYPILNTMTLKQEGEQENRGLDFYDIKTAIDFFRPLVKGLQSDDGILIYFASPSSDGSVNKGKCGRLTLFLVVTTGPEKREKLPYYKFDFTKKTFVAIELSEARNGVQNYQLTKRKALFETLYNQDKLDSCKETKHIWFNKEQMNETVKEMEYQSQKPGSKVDGFGIRFVSYTDKDYSFLGSELPKYTLRQRLTIGFTFIKNNQDVGIEVIDEDEFKKRLEITKNRFLGGTFDTGFPAPPPPKNDNMAALDVEN